MYLIITLILLGRKINKNKIIKGNTNLFCNRKSSGFRPFENGIEINVNTNFKGRYNVFYTSNLVVVDFLKGPDVLLSIGNSY
jgi:hypothetical protein